DMEVWREVMARTIVAAGGRRGDLLQNAFGYGLFTGGLGFHQAAELIGMTVVPASSGNTARQCLLLRDFKPAALCATPSFALHIADDHFLPEIVDPATGEPLGAGEQGELVLTTLTKRAMPVVRYRTGDVTTLTTAPCRCGRTSARMGRLVGRADDMLIIKGV